jgi:superfamily I DNA/RNA helicase
MSNALISHEPARTRPVPLLADRARPGAHVVVVQHHTASDEVESLADYIADFLRKNPDLPPGQVLVLAPRRFIGNAIRDALITRGLNATSYFSEDPVQSTGAAEGFALLTLLVNPADRPALRAWLGMGNSSGREPGYRRVRQAAVAANKEPREIVEALATGEDSLPHTDGLLDRWRQLQRRLKELDELTGLELVRAVWPAGDEDSDDIRLMAENIAVTTADPAQILDQLRKEVTQPYLPDSDSDVVRIMSLHKSKGLTASLVVIAGAMAGALPQMDRDLTPAEQEAQLHEARRLFYVAITRATKTLIISAPRLIPFADAMRAQVNVVRTMFSGGQQFAVAAMSPFIGELGGVCPPPVSGTQWRDTEEF